MFDMKSLMITALTCGSFAAGKKHSQKQAQDVLLDGIKALGGSDRLENVKAVTYIGNTVYRTRTLMEAYSMTGVDNMMSPAGSQNMSFSYDQPHIKQRIDRFHESGEMFLLARPALDPFKYSLAVQGGDKGYAAVVDGTMNLFVPNSPPQGYIDGLLAAYLIFDAERMSPKLLSTILSNNNYSTSLEDAGMGLKLPAVHDKTLDLTVLFNPDTKLPYIIRSYEDHGIYGNSTQDLVVYNCTTVDGVEFPGRFKIMYNKQHILMDYQVDTVIVNPDLDPKVFDGPQGQDAMSYPTRDSSYDFSEIGEWYTNYLWSGAYRGTLANISATTPLPNMPEVWFFNFPDGSGYHHLVLQWAKETLGKAITHVWRMQRRQPSHHHHDHALGLKDYIAAGAKAVVLDQAQEYYSNIPGIQFVTYSADKPITFKDSRKQVTIVHLAGSAHAFDQAYATITPICPTANSTMAVFEADYWNPHFADADLFVDHTEAAEFLNNLGEDRVAKDSLVIPAHGVGTDALTHLIDLLGVPYPSYSAKDFKYSACPSKM
ncbi:metallo-beta-lactamase superfamily [Fusarium mexicanum]|uniref:Metallo-beta-lactamase superfamily n=1 Tax=Fusarium mexicanum TaxID=751941 RepID=A0A8H5JIG3_9HYPO|nr:metallo-beta-lactamase superfamily [Fusarium mexicanum]